MFIENKGITFHTVWISSIFWPTLNGFRSCQISTEWEIIDLTIDAKESITAHSWGPLDLPRFANLGVRHLSAGIWHFTLVAVRGTGT